MELVELSPADARLTEVWAVLGRLRTQLAAETFHARYAAAHAHGYRVTAGYVDGRCIAAAGWRITTSLVHGRFLYVDDLVVEPEVRSRGHGAALLAALEARAATAGCTRVRLDSGVQRREAHRFYLREGYTITTYGLAKELG